MPFIMRTQYTMFCSRRVSGIYCGIVVYTEDCRREHYNRNLFGEFQQNFLCSIPVLNYNNSHHHLICTFSSALERTGTPTQDSGIMQCYSTIITQRSLEENQDLCSKQLFST